MAVAETIDCNTHQEMPGVLIGISKGFAASGLTQAICYGLEEEQVPFRLVHIRHRIQNRVKLAYWASQQSFFGIGISSTPQGVALHHNRFPEMEPVFDIPEHRCTPKTARLIGINAARLIKGMALESI